jgi:hypothetical protein
MIGHAHRPLPADPPLCRFRSQSLAKSLVSLVIESFFFIATTLSVTLFLPLAHYHLVDLSECAPTGPGPSLRRVPSAGTLLPNKAISKAAPVHGFHRCGRAGRPKMINLVPGGAGGLECLS